MSHSSGGYGASLLAGAVRQAYRQGQTDYSLEPLVLADGQGLPVGRIQDGDAVIFCCRRGEREIQLTEAFTEPDFAHFPRQKFQALNFVIFTLYHEKFKDLPVAFAPRQIQDTLGEVASRAGLRQLRCAESEKFAHVTFFLNGGSHLALPGEDTLQIASPTGIPYDQAPGLSLACVAQQVLKGIQQGYDLIVTNFANGDVIGHTASRGAKLSCAEIVDQHLGQVVSAARRAGYAIFITADHGNLEEMLTPDGMPHVAHTGNPVPFMAIDPRTAAPLELRKGGALSDIAPTLLQSLGLPQPSCMDGSSLAPRHDWQPPRRSLLIILDGWGLGKEDDTNPIYLANTPAWDDLRRHCACTALDASGEAVGLQPGKPGNSEAGHINMGAGRVVLQDDLRLDRAMQDGSFYTNPVLCHAIQDVQQRDTRLHLIGILSDKSSHGTIDYPLALLQMAQRSGLEKVYLHLIFDGRSTPPGSAPALLERLERQVEQIGTGHIVSGVGRGIALDRNGNYARTRLAYEALVSGSGQHYSWQ